MTNAAKKLCIYHGNCDDGFGAAFAVWLYDEYNEFEFYPGVYQKEPPDVTGKDVYLVDFSYKRPVLREMANKARTITIIDHHKSAMEDLAGLDHEFGNVEIHFDMNKSGAFMAWEYFHGTEPPWLFKYIQDNDLWRHKLPDCRAVIMALRMYPQDFEVWDKILDDGFEDLTAQGASIWMWYQQQVKFIKEHNTKIISLGGFDVPVCNANYCFASELAGQLAETAPFAICYYHSADRVNFSLRSRGDGGVDVSQIARMFGGGGHKNAAGFAVPKDHDLVKLL